MIPRRVKIVFTDKFHLDLIDGFVETNAMGFGAAYRGEDKRIVLVRPSSEKDYTILKEQLDVWVNDGLLTYEEQT
jgi:hypothetical protein